ncbi:MAG: hypothetical protein IJY47_02555, partial [Clostridia bacterium]|nr:hypothetical protein [Clostridia bacterium]
MRKSVRFLTVFIGILLMVSWMSLGAGAENSIYDQNYGLSLEKRNQLETQIGAYNTKDTSAGKTCASNTSSVIGEYQASLTELGRDTVNLNTNAINLTYAQGQAAGRLAWIHYSHADEVAATRSVYEAQKATIDGKAYADISSFFEGENPGVNACYTAMLSAIYKSKYENMKEAGDSAKVTLKINAAIDDVTNKNSADYLTYTDEDATNYKNHYNLTLTDVTQQRNRDTVSDQLKEIFVILYPEVTETFENPSNPRLMYFFGKIDSKTAVADMNDLLLNAVNGLLDDLKDGGTYVDPYIDALKSSVSTSIQGATSASKVATPLSLFGNHTVDLYRAKQKDVLLAYGAQVGADYTAEHRAALDDVLAEYHGAGTELDNCTDKDSIDAVVRRAKLRADWYNDYVSALADIAAYVGDNEDLEGDAYGDYLRVDGVLKTADESEWNTLYTKGQKDLSDVIAEAEGKAYESKHALVLSKQLADIAVSDLVSLETAIADAEGLSDQAAQVLADKLVRLGDKYKVAIQKKIQATTKADACENLRNQYIEELNKKVNALSTDDLNQLKEQAELFVDKAGRISAVLDRYAGILGADGYASYKETFRTAMENTVTGAATDLVLAAPTDGQTLAQRLTKLTSDAILNLDRQEGIAQVYAAAKDSTLPEVTQILTDTQNKINAATDRATIPVLRSDAIKEIDACLAREDMKNRNAALKAEIDAMTYLSDAEKKTYKEQADAAFTSGNGALTNGSAASALSVFDTAYTACKNAAIERNLANAKAIKLEELRDQLDQLRNTVNGYTYMDSATKQQYLTAIDQLKSEVSESISEAADLSALQTKTQALSGQISTLSQQVADVEVAHKALSDTQDTGTARLTAAYEALLVNKEFYSQSSLDDLKKLYERSLAEIESYQNLSDLDALNLLVDNKIASLRAIPYSRLYTEDKLLADSSYDLLHPTGYNPSNGGYVGSVEASAGLPSQADLSILAVEDPDIIKTIREAAKGQKVRLAHGTYASEGLLERLRTCQLGAALDIDMGDVTLPGNNTYSVSVLLADDVNMANVIGVVYVCEDGSVEFYEITSEASLVRFTTTHFSNYYVVTDKVVNLIPVIVLLALLVLCEIAVVIFLYVRRSRTAQPKQETFASVALPLFLLTKYTPAGGFWAIGVLSFAALALGGWIVYLVLSERSAERDTETETEEITVTEIPEEEEPVLAEDPAFEEEFEEEAEMETEPETEQAEEMAVLGAAEERMVLSAAEEPVALGSAEERMALSAAEELAALNAAERPEALHAAEERNALCAAEERAVLEGREELPALDSPEEADASAEETNIYEGSFTESTDDWVGDMVRELPDSAEELPTEEETVEEEPEETFEEAEELSTEEEVAEEEAEETFEEAEELSTEEEVAEEEAEEISEEAEELSTEEEVAEEEAEEISEEAEELSTEEEVAEEEAEETTEEAEELSTEEEV